MSAKLATEIKYQHLSDSYEELQAKQQKEARSLTTSYESLEKQLQAFKEQLPKPLTSSTTAGEHFEPNGYKRRTTSEMKGTSKPSELNKRSRRSGGEKNIAYRRNIYEKDQKMVKDDSNRCT